MNQLATISRMRAFRACARYHHLNYVERLESVDDDEGVAIAFGNAGHRVLETWWGNLHRSDLADGDLLRMCLMQCDADDEIRDTLTEHQRAALKAVIAGYHLRWYEASLRYDVLHVEVAFRTVLRNPATGRPLKGWDQGGKMDVIVRDRESGQVLVIEHKFSGEDVSPGSVYWQRLRVDGQISIYLDGARTLGYDVAGCIYDVIARPAQKPKKATPIERREYTKGKGCKVCRVKAGEQGRGYLELSGGRVPCAACTESPGWEEAPRLYKDQRLEDETPAEYGIRVAEAIAENPLGYFGRGDVVRFDEEAEDARLDVYETVLAMRESMRTGRAPRNTDACTRLYGRVCPFLSICSREASLDDPAKYRRREHQHPELVGL
jgi:hypothetical protein